MLRISFAVGLIFCASNLFSQVFWTEDFGNSDCSAAGTTANGYNSANGVWTVTETGANGPGFNPWFVSATEAGMAEGECGDGCLDNAALTDNTLHVSSSDIGLGDVGAAYFETGFDNITNTDRRVESPEIDCSGQVDITLSFLYIAAGTPGTDQCSIEYFDGAAWSELAVLPPSPATAPCNPQGTWTAISFALPASANNNPNVRIGYRWVNADDGEATDPSVAIDDITLEVGAINEVFADFEANETDICTGDCIDFNDLSTGDDIDTWNWTFEGGDVTASSDQNPAGICYENAGVYAVTLQVSNPDDTDEITITDYITVTECLSPPTADFNGDTLLICEGECVDFQDVSIGDGIDTWEWTFNGADITTSNDQNPTDICYASAGSYDVTLFVSNAAGDDQITLENYITVEVCGSPPLADFMTNLQNICVGDCIDFSDESLGSNITDWEWVFEGAETGASTDQNPVDICYANPGSYDVTLIVTNAEGTDQITIEDYITVEDCSAPPVADFLTNVQNICVGDCIDFIDSSEGANITDWEWEFNGAETALSADQNPADICYQTEGSFDVTLTVTNDNGSDVITLEDFIVVQACAGPQADFTASETVICEGDCIDFTDLSIGGGGSPSYSWTFTGADNPDSDFQNPAGICYSTPGQYDVTLEVSDGVDVDQITIPNFITVETCAPEPDFDLEIEASANVICVGDCVDFEDITVSGDETITDWMWSFPGGDPAMSFNQNPLEVCYLNVGSYDVTLEVEVDGATADSTFSDFITVVDTCGPVANFDYTPIVCLGQCYSFTNTSIGGDEYFWTFEGGLPETSEEESPSEICYLDQTGTFAVTLTVVNEFGSSTSITQQITVVNPPIVNAGPDQTITQGTSTTISVSAGTGAGSITWQPFEEVVCFSCPSTSTVPIQETTTFVVFYEESGGCQASDTVTVFVLEDVFSAGVPNSFSPNGDGVNDILYVRGNNISQLRLIIYNRYGQKVFETNTKSEGWDGTMNGRELNAGVFGYYLEANFADGTQQVEKGDITLVR